jgi:hypothetical protein
MELVWLLSRDFALHPQRPQLDSFHQSLIERTDQRQKPAHTDQVPFTRLLVTEMHNVPAAPAAQPVTPICTNYCVCCGVSVPKISQYVGNMFDLQTLLTTTAATFHAGEAFA